MDLSRMLRDLLRATRASRATIRLDVAGMSFPVVAEALRGPVRAIAGNNTIDQRSVATVRHMLATRDILVQPDLEHADVAPPPALLEIYAARAQMLAPILHGEQVIGYVSVHQCGHAREWTPADIRSLRRVTDDVASYFA
jgi:maleate isomerase